MATAEPVCNAERTSSVAVTTSDKSNGCNSARVRDDDDTDGVVAPTPAVVTVEDEDGEAGEGDDDDDDDGSVIEGRRLVVVAPKSDLLREAVAEELPTSDPDPDPEPEPDAVFPEEERGVRGDDAGGDAGTARDDVDVLLLLLVLPTRPLRYCAFHCRAEREMSSIDGGALKSSFDSM